jgi:pimeloyl-ACP methyl ester carboxylesterase
MSVEPFTIAVPDDVVDDLRQRLARTRWPHVSDGDGWGRGVDLSYLRDLCAHWENDYDWRAQEATLNRLPQFTTEVDGVRVHFVHARGVGPSPTPLLLTHGWPDSFHRFHKVIPMLTDPERHGGRAVDAFDVIVPSVPGFGFSDRVARPSTAVADLWAALMTSLGYDRFAAAGGDVGQGVTMALALRHPERLTGIHLTDVGYPTGQETDLSPAEQTFAEFIRGWWFMEGAYAALHMTKPNALAPALHDSPAGLAAWMLSFLNSGADANRVEDAFGGRDALLTNLTLYWVTETAKTSMQMYQEDVRAAFAGDSPAAGRSTVPAGIARFPREAPFPREWAERFVNVQRFNDLPEGGHFAALEVPDVFTSELRTFFAELSAGQDAR